MLTSIEGVYRNGRVELIEHPTGAYEGERVIVTFIRADRADLRTDQVNLVGSA